MAHLPTGPSLSDLIPSVPDLLHDAWFELRSADLAAVPEMARDAVDRLDLAGGVVKYMALERGRPYHADNDVRRYVYVNGDQERQGLVEYAATGQFREAWQWKRDSRK